MGDYQPKHYRNTECTSMTFTTKERHGAFPTLGYIIGTERPDLDCQSDTYVEDLNAQGMQNLRHLCDVLEALGCGTSISSERTMDGECVILRITHPSVEDAKATRTRNAGRRTTETPSGSPLDGLAPNEALQWLYDHTPAEGCAALGGVSTRTRKRRIAELRKQVAGLPCGLESCNPLCGWYPDCEGAV